MRPRKGYLLSCWCSVLEMGCRAPGPLSSGAYHKNLAIMDTLCHHSGEWVCRYCPYWLLLVLTSSSWYTLCSKNEYIYSQGIWLVPIVAKARSCWTIICMDTRLPCANSCPSRLSCTPLAYHLLWDIPFKTFTFALCLIAIQNQGLCIAL